MAEEPRPTDAELLAELGPLAAVIADKLRTVPVRLGPGGANDLVSELTLAVAVYVGRHVLPADTQPLLQALAKPPCPPREEWQVMTMRRGGWHTWAGPRDDRDEAREEYEDMVARHGHEWAYRLVRATTSWAVEAEHTPEAGHD